MKQAAARVRAALTRGRIVEAIELGGVAAVVVGVSGFSTAVAWITAGVLVVLWAERNS